jgi:hypothetical protein
MQYGASICFAWKVDLGRVGGGGGTEKAWVHWSIDWARRGLYELSKHAKSRQWLAAE